MPKPPSYVAGLDLGSSRTRCVVGMEENGRLRCVSYGAARSGGWRKGVIVDQDPVVQSIEQAVAEAEANGELSIESVVVGVGATVSSAVSTGPVSLSASQPIERTHLNEAVKTAARAKMGEDRMLLQAIPIDFSVDGQGGIRNPLGMMGRRLDAQVRLITASTQAHMNLTTVVNRAGIVVVVAGVFAADIVIGVAPEVRRGAAEMRARAHAVEQLETEQHAGQRPVVPAVETVIDDGVLRAHLPRHCGLPTGRPTGRPVDGRCRSRIAIVEMGVETGVAFQRMDDADLGPGQTGEAGGRAFVAGPAHSDAADQTVDFRQLVVVDRHRTPERDVFVADVGELRRRDDRAGFVRPVYQRRIRRVRLLRLVGGWDRNVGWPER